VKSLKQKFVGFEMTHNGFIHFILFKRFSRTKCLFMYANCKPNKGTYTKLEKLYLWHVQPGAWNQQVDATENFACRVAIGRPPVQHSLRKYLRSRRR